MSSSLMALEIDALRPTGLAAFWSVLLDRPTDATGTRLPGRTDVDVELRFVLTAIPTLDRHRMHMDLTSATEESQRDTVARAIELGASPLDVGQRGDEGHVVLADPEGNEFCVIEAGNQFLRDTARIGALAGDGMPAVGYFWARVLNWPLVWDQDQETAIQSPRGGTKITWGGPPVAPKTSRNRLRWVLRADRDIEAELSRLVGLGATCLVSLEDHVELADPEGNEFLLERPLGHRRNRP